MTSLYHTKLPSCFKPKHYSGPWTIRFLPQPGIMMVLQVLLLPVITYSFTLHQLLNRPQHQVSGLSVPHDIHHVQERKLPLHCYSNNECKSILSMDTSSRNEITDSTTATATTISLLDLEIMRLQPEIHVQESMLQHEVNDGSFIILATRIVKEEDNNSSADIYHQECEYEGYLVRHSHHRHYEAHLSCSSEVYTDMVKYMDNIIAVLQKSIHHYLIKEQEHYEKKIQQSSFQPQKDIISSPSPTLSINLDGISNKEIIQRLKEIGISSISNHLEYNGVDSSKSLGIELSTFVPYLHEYAFRHRGTEQGITSLDILQLLCQRRVPFDFTNQSMNMQTTIVDDATSSVHRNVISHQKQILPTDVVEQINTIMNDIKARQWLSTNPDSVDGLPSLHLNLISNGSPMFTDEDDSVEVEDDVTFPKYISQMTNILEPILYNDLLPKVRKMTETPGLDISDVFIRNYGVVDEKQEDESNSTGQEKKSRYVLSPHYDVTAFSTCVMALDSTAANGENGLYTIPLIDGKSSNNAALKQFFPLNQGDGVVHTFDVLHGVDVDPKLNCPRTSLIIWFIDRSVQDGGNGELDVNQPWLLNPVDDIGEFVLGLASESSVEEDGSHLKLKKAIDPLELYLSSASRGNIFAMTRLAQMCDDELVPKSEYGEIESIILGQELFNPFLTNESDFQEQRTSSSKVFAKALWYHASISGGNRVAQVSLADELMLKYTTEKENLTEIEQENLLLMASTLFTMSLNQGYDARDSLQRLMNVECARLEALRVNIPSDEFFNQPVVNLLMKSL